MNWRQALTEYYSSFGMAAYPQESVEEDAEFPWITYNMNRGDFGEETALTLHTHHYTSSEAIPNAKADEIVKSMRGGKMIHCDEGMMMIFPALPEWLSAPDQNDKNHKHRIINATIHWLLTR